MPYVRNKQGQLRYTLKRPALGGAGSALNLNYAVAPSFKPPRPTPPPAITAPGNTGSVFTPQPIYREPNWGALIAGDPEMIGAESEMNMLNQMDRGTLRDSIRRAVIESGLGVGVDEDVDEGTLAAARANQFSSAADIANQLRRGSAQSDAELAARGALYSGQFTENRQQLQKAADLARNTVQGNLLDRIASGRGAYTSAVAERQANLRNLRAQIASRLASNPGLFLAGYTSEGGGGGGGAGVGPAAAPIVPPQQYQTVTSRPLTGGSTANYRYPIARPPAPVARANPAEIAGYTWKNGVQYARMRDGRLVPASAFGARF